MIYTKFTSAWNVARIVVILAAFGLICMSKAFSFGGFAPSLDVGNTQDLDHVRQHERDEDRRNEEAYDRIKDDVANGREPSERDAERACEWIDAHVG